MSKYSSSYKTDKTILVGTILELSSSKSMLIVIESPSIISLSRYVEHPFNKILLFFFNLSRRLYEILNFPVTTCLMVL